MPEVNDRRDLLNAFEDRDGIYEYQALNGALYVKLTGSVFNDRAWKLVIGVETPSSYGGDIDARPVDHASRVRGSELANATDGIIQLVNGEEDIREVSTSMFDIEGIHDRYHDRRRAYFRAEVREVYED